MNTDDFESLITSPKAQETANASSTYTVATINCQDATGQIASVGNIENDSPPNSQTNSSSTIPITNSGTIKVFAPVITHDVTLPNTAKKVPMVMVPVPDSRTLMAIPISTLSQLKESQMDIIKDEQQARDLLIWNEGIGTLDGCDLRFKINQLGCLELLDSDDESENQTLHSATKKQQNAISSTSANQSSNNNNTNNNNTNAASNIARTTNGLGDSNSTGSDRFHHQKKVKLVAGTESAPIRQISPGSSLLRDGPNTRRPKPSSAGSNHSSSGRLQSNSLSLLKKLEQNQNSILLDKLVPKQRLDEIKANVEQWTIEDVKNFVNTIPGCSGYGELFESQQICGKSLMYLDQKDLLDVINVKLGPAVKIYHAISLIK